MSHSALEIENWKKIEVRKKLEISYNHRAEYIGLDIPASKFYFFLKKKFGMTNVSYESIAQFFPIKMLSLENEWCYVFQANLNFVLVCGDDKINMTVLSIKESPSKLDFDLFSNKIESELKSITLSEFNNIGYDIYISYSFHLKTLISDCKSVFLKKLPSAPEELHLLTKDLESIDEEAKYKFIENCHDYNHWLKLLLEKSTVALKIQILLPIYFESLVDLAFRIKLKKSLFNKKKIYGEREYKLDIFEFFEQLPINKKIEEIKTKCNEVDDQKIKKFMEQIKNNRIRKERNKLLHGNSLFFRNSNLKYYLDGPFFIGLPDKARGFRAIAESINSSMDEKRTLDTIRIYEKQCDDFIDIFKDNEYFRSLVSSIAFGHNSDNGGCVSIGLNKYEDLLAPTEWS